MQGKILMKKLLSYWRLIVGTFMKVQATPGYYVTSKALGIILGYKVCRMSLPMVAL